MFPVRKTLEQVLLEHTVLRGVFLFPVAVDALPTLLSYACLERWVG